MPDVKSKLNADDRRGAFCAPSVMRPCRRFKVRTVVNIVIREEKHMKSGKLQKFQELTGDTATLRKVDCMFPYLLRCYDSRGNLYLKRHFASAQRAKEELEKMGSWYTVAGLVFDDDDEYYGKD